MNRQPTHLVQFLAITVMAIATLSPASGAENAHLVKDFNPGGNTYFNGPMAEGDGTLLFVRSPLIGGSGFELWSSRGTEADTIHIPIDALIAYQPISFMNRGYFFALNPEHKTEWWSSDGTVAGTRRMTIAGNIDGSPYSPLISSEGLIYTVRPTTGFDAPPYHLWCSDSYNAWVVATFPNTRISNLTSTAQGPFFVSTDATQNQQLWRFDTTQQAPILVRTFAPGSSAVVLSNLVGVQSLVFFTVAGSGEADGLWCSDGTATGTIPLGIVPEGAGVSFMNHLLFCGHDALHGSEPWISDGTPAGTFRLNDVVVGANGSNPSSMTVANGQAFFFCDPAVADEPRPNVQLWRTDGTIAGTRMVTKVWYRPGYWSGTAVVGRDLFFNNSDAAHGLELWRSDGTASGTHRCTDINPGPADSVVMHITEAGGRIFMQAADDVHGYELWAYEADTQAPRLVMTTPSTPVVLLTKNLCRLMGSLSDNIGVTRMDITCSGATNSHGTVIFNPVAESSIPFDLSIAIEHGITRLRISATDEAGNRASTQRVALFRANTTTHTALAMDFLSPTATSAGKYQLTDQHFPGALLLAMNEAGEPATTVSYRLSGSTTGEGTAHRTADGDWQIEAQTFQPGTTVIAATARDADGQTATASLEVIVPQADSASSSDRRCGSGSGIAGLLMVLGLIGLRRRLR